MYELDFHAPLDTGFQTLGLKVPIMCLLTILNSEE
jgi:hypothetical protein